MRGRTGLYWIGSFCALAVAAVAYIVYVHKTLYHPASRDTISGVVASTHYVESGNGQPTFLNLGKPYPDQDWTVVIWGRDRGNFPQPPEKFYLHKNITATGEATRYRNKSQLTVHEPSQIVVK